MKLHLECINGREYIYQFKEVVDGLDAFSDKCKVKIKDSAYFKYHIADGNLMNEDIFKVSKEYFETDYEYMMPTEKILRYWIEG